MKERPILFSGAMVRAILNGKKTQTRRVMSIPPVEVFPSDTPNVTIYRMNGEPLKQWFIFPREIDGLIEYLRPGVGKKPSKKQAQRASNWLHSYRRGDVKWSIDEVMGLCPYGVPGDRLYVKEATWLWCERRPNGTTKTGRQKWHYVPVPNTPPVYVADHPAKPDWGYPIETRSGNVQMWKYKTARFMPRWASRITLEIADVRVQRVQEISYRDSVAEGVSESPFAQTAFSRLWDSINSKRGHGWEKNDWVWALTFKRVQS